MTAARSIAEPSAARRLLGPVRRLSDRLAAAMTTFIQAQPDTAAREDRDTEAVFRQSRLGSTLLAADRAVENAWTDSLAGRRLADMAAATRRMNDAVRAGAVCLTAVAAGVTALVLREMASRVEPLTWIVPAVVAGGALVLLYQIHRRPRPAGAASPAVPRRIG